MTVSLAYSYSKVQVTLHWISAVVIIWALVSGSLLVVLDVSAALKKGLTAFNVSITAVFIPFFAIRLYLAARAAAIRGLPRSRYQWVVCTTHHAIYVLTSVVLASGVLMMSESIRLFDIVQFDPFLQAPTQHQWFAWLHTWSCVALAGLLALHIGAVIKHQLSGQPVIKRMWF